MSVNFVFVLKTGFGESHFFSKNAEQNVPTRVLAYFCNPEFAGFLNLRWFYHSLYFETDYILKLSVLNYTFGPIRRRER